MRPRNSLFACKPVRSIMSEGKSSPGGLRRALGVLDLMAIGVGAVIGAGIFVLTGVAAQDAGPAVSLSFVLAAIACGFVALCYSELSTLFPVTGSAYIYTYAALGELWAWLVGWALILEYTLGAAVVAEGWSGYVRDLLQDRGILLPLWMRNDPWSTPGALIDFPAVALVLTITGIVVVGIQESARFSRIMVFTKVLIVLFVIGVGGLHIQPANWQPFMPFGALSIIQAAAVVFIAYIGFDVISATAEEVTRPDRDLPLGLIGTVAACALLYTGVALVLTGMVPYTQINISDPVASAFQSAGLRFVGNIIAVGVIVGLISVMTSVLIGQPRIFFAMARDGLLPPWVERIHPRFKTPALITVVSGGVIALVAGLVPLDTLVHMTSLGTLVAFSLVCAAVLVLRRRYPDLPRPFRCPGVPWVPLGGMLICLILMLELPSSTWLRILAWMVIGLLVYFVYGFRHSKLREACSDLGQTGRKNAKDRA
jgi:APA family basic amino acid/polyamine antiporter